MPVGVDQDVGRLDVAVNDSVAVRLVQRVGGLAEQAQGVPERRRTPLHVLGQASPFDILHDQERETVLQAYVREGADVRMAEGGDARPRIEALRTGNADRCVSST